MYRPIAAACAVLALAACATPTVYAPANPNAASSVGFSEYRIENNRYRVTFQGGSGAPPQLVNDYAFLRAAEGHEDQLAHGALMRRGAGVR